MCSTSEWIPIEEFSRLTLNIYLFIPAALLQTDGESIFLKVPPV